MEGPIVGFLLSTTVGLGLTIVTFIVARKSGLAPVQERLVDTLQENAAALTSQVGLLKEQIEQETTRRQALEREVARLRAAVADLATENAELRRKVGLPTDRETA